MKIYLVGGAIRDKLLGLPIKEKDWVIVGGTIADLLHLGYRQVGKEFPVFIHPKTGEEYALARMERKVKPGYQGFTFDTSSGVSLEDDLARRDLTINAMAETGEGQLIDPYHGKKDIEGKWLRHVSPAFVEDPVRILRVGRFLARYASLGFRIAPETLQLMQNMVALGEINALVAERVWKELERALGEKNPEKFFEVLSDCQALPFLFPSLLINEKGIAALKAAVRLTTDPTIRFAALFHYAPHNSDEQAHAKAAVAALCNRYRVPNTYRQLAAITINHCQTALAAHTLSADELLSFLYALDVFRREDRFYKFLIACEAIDQISTASTLNRFCPAWLKNMVLAVKMVDVQALISKGFEGNELALALKKERKVKVEAYMNNPKNACE